MVKMIDVHARFFLIAYTLKIWAEMQQNNASVNFDNKFDPSE